MGEVAAHAVLVGEHVDGGGRRRCRAVVEADMVVYPLLVLGLIFLLSKVARSRGRLAVVTASAIAVTSLVGLFGSHPLGVDRPLSQEDASAFSWRGFRAKRTIAPP